MTQLHLLPRTERDYERAADDYCRSLPLEHFMEAKPQATQREITLESLALLKVRRRDVHVFNEMLVQYPSEEGLGQVVPDNMVVISKKPLRAVGSYNLPYEPAKPFLVMEYISANSRRKDYTDSFHKYEKELRVRYCLLFHTERQDLQVYRHTGRRYKQLEPNAAARYAIPELGLEVGLRDGWVRFWYQGQLLELPAELQQKVQVHKRRAEKEKKLRVAAEAEVERLRAVVEKLQRENGARPKSKH